MAAGPPTCGKLSGILVMQVWKLALRSSSPATGVIWALRAQRPKRRLKMDSQDLSAPEIEKVKKEWS